VTGLTIIWAAFLVLAFWAVRRSKRDTLAAVLFGAWVILVVAETALIVAGRIWPGLIPS
jgi:hypothetical protein